MLLARIEGSAAAETQQTAPEIAVDAAGRAPRSVLD